MKERNTDLIIKVVYDGYFNPQYEAYLVVYLPVGADGNLLEEFVDTSQTFIGEELHRLWGYESYVQIDRPSRYRNLNLSASSPEELQDLINQNVKEIKDFYRKFACKFNSELLVFKLNGVD